MEEFDRMGRRKRKDYSKLPKILELPNLLEVQKTSYNNFLQKGVAPKDRKNVGLQSVFNEVFPMQSIKGNITIEYAGYSIGEPKFKVIECKERGLSFGAPLKFSARLLVTDPENPSAKVKEIKEQEVIDRIRRDSQYNTPEGIIEISEDEIEAIDIKKKKG